MLGLVRGTKLRQYTELNRMAFADWLPRNSESRAIGVAMRLLKKQYPHLKWVVSFADACQCGDGIIYRASGFLLTDIRVNKALRIDPKTGEIKHAIRAHHDKQAVEYRNWKPIDGYMLRYLYFLHPDERDNLTVPVIPFSAIKEAGVGMYKGKQLATN